MPRARRLQVPGAVFHVWLHEAVARPFFDSDADRRLLMCLLVEHLGRCGVRGLAWCFMSNHLHLVVQDEEARLPEAMHAIGSAFGRQRARQLGTPGPVLRSRYAASHIADDRYFLTAVKYVSCNAVHHGACARPEQWRWCSHHGIVDGAPDPLLDLDAVETLVERDRLLAFLADDRHGVLVPPPGLPRRLLSTERPSLDMLRHELGLIEAVPAADAFRYTRAEIADAYGLTIQQVRTLLH